MSAPAKAPCVSCPYRCDVPAGVWDASEYAKLPGYDGEPLAQLLSGATAVFYCHQRNGKFCSGWLATHGPENLLALHVTADEVSPETWDYKSPVPVFGSGLEAAEHGVSGVVRPGKAARRMIAKLSRRLGL